MRDLCLDEGTLQSFCDGELEPKALEQVRLHIASCTFCEAAARDVESEMELATGAFAAELALNVPTERLRNRIDDAIAGLAAFPVQREENATTRLRAWFTSLASTFNLSPQRAIGFASLVIFFVLAVVIGGIVIRQRDSRTGLETVASTQDDPSDFSFSGVPNGAEVINLDPAKKQRPRRRSVRQTGLEAANEGHTNHRMLPGEKNYLQAISLLTEAIEVNGENSLKPTLLADYKRNLEVVNQAIVATQLTARTNPKSPDAADMLFAVYQSKLDLLSAVAEQSRPMIAQR